MAEIVNLNRVKKAKARAEADAQAAANRAKHGRTRTQRLADATLDQHAHRTLDGAKLSRDGEPQE